MLPTVAIHMPRNSRAGSSGAANEPHAKAKDSSRGKIGRITPLTMAGGFRGRKPPSGFRGKEKGARITGPLDDKFDVTP